MQYGSRVVHWNTQPVDEYQGLPLRSCNRIEGGKDVPSHFCRRYDVWLEPAHARPATCPNSESANTLPVQVHGRTKDVTLWRLHSLDAVPSLIGTSQGLLREVLSLHPVGTQEEERLCQLRIG